MDVFLGYRIGIVVIIALIYMLFDVFNRRNVPAIFAYASIIIGVILTLLYYPNLQTITESGAIALIIGSIGYFFYRSGQLGAADVIEFAAISLMLPIQPAAYLYNVAQLNLPFIISVFIAAGIIALLFIPLYYLPRAKRLLKKSLPSMIGKKDIYKGALLALAYLIFIGFLVYELGVGIPGVALLFVVMLSSVTTATFETPITNSMVEFITIDKFEEGDIIALGLMRKPEVASLKKRVRGFDKLATAKVIKTMKKLRIRNKFPVYRSAMPLALPIFIGIVLSILFGNLMLLIL